MVFSSLIFLFVFLPIFMGIYYLTPKRFKSFIILIGSLIFYGWWRVDFLFLMVAVIYWNYLISIRIAANGFNERSKRWMQIGVTIDLLTLGVFKYYNFGIDSLNAILNASGINTIETLRFILPIGISFYIFHSISFLVDVYRKDEPPPQKFSDFAAFIALFPQLVAGPVLRYKDVADQFYNRKHSFDKFSHGAYRFMSGFIKKVLIADTVAELVNKSFALENPTMADAWIGALAYTVQLYFDFSGYSSMAVGLGLMIGFKFMENFDHPYISRSITEFWRRWHISLSTWLRDYLYIPLGGNRKGEARTYVNLLITMVLGGFWHGAQWTFILWGAWHGGILAIERALGGGKKSESKSVMSCLRQGGAMLFTLLLVIIGWIMFRATSVEQAFEFYGAMLGSSGYGISDALDWQITGAAVTALIAGYVFIFAIPFIEHKKQMSMKETRNGWIHLVTILLFVFSVVKLGAASYSPFLYFQF